MNNLFKEYLTNIVLYSEFSDDLNASLIDLEFDILSNHISNSDELADLKSIFKIYYLTVIDYVIDDLLIFKDPVFYESPDVDSFDLDVFSFSKGLVLIKFKLLDVFIDNYTSIYFKDSILFKQCLTMMNNLPKSKLTLKILDLYDPYIACYDRFVKLSNQLSYYIKRYIDFLMLEDMTYLSSELQILGYINAVDLMIPFETRYNQFLISQDVEPFDFETINRVLALKEADGLCKTLVKSVNFI